MASPVDKTLDKSSGESHADSRPGPEIFQKEVPLQQKIVGTVNGKSFTILGKGAGDARIGKLKGKWICTSSEAEDNRCPMAWAVLAPTFAYGYKVYAKYPSDMVNFFQSTFPHGYTQRRITRFQRMYGNDCVEEEGTMTTSHDITLRAGLVMGELTWVVHNQVTLTATFKEGSVLLDNNSASIFLQSLERCVPCGDGVKNYVQYFYPVKDASNGDVIIATQMTHNRPHCMKCHTARKEDPMIPCAHREPVPLPSAHFKRTECKQWRDPQESRDHVLQDEINEMFSFAHEGTWTEIGMPEIENMSMAPVVKKGEGQEVPLGEYRKEMTSENLAHI